MRYLIFLLIILFLSRCENRDKPPSPKYSFIEFYENGRIKSEGDTINGLRIGCWRYYNENGSPKAEGCYKNGLKDGKWRYYRDNSPRGDSIIWSIYRNRYFSYAINYPENWEVKPAAKKTEIVGFFNYKKAKPFFENFNIVPHEFHRDFSLNKELEFMMGSYGSSLDIITTYETVINGNETVLIVFVVTDGKLRLKVFQAAIKQGTTLFLISCFSEEKDFLTYQNIFKEAVFSFTQL